MEPNEITKLGPIASAAALAVSGSAIKTPARDPLQASPTRDVSSPSGLPAGGNPLQSSFSEVGKPTAAATGPVDAHGNDMTATNKMKAQLGEAPIGEPSTGAAPVVPRNPLALVAGYATPSAAPEQGPAANPLTSINMQANNDSLARANAIRQQMIDGDGEGPKVTMLENSGLKETQALMDKWGRQDMQREMLQEMSRNPRAANAIAGLAANANNTEAQLRGQDIEASTAEQNALSRLAGQGVAAETEKRGQDLRAASEAAKLAGNPLTNALVQAQTETERLAGDKTRHQNDVLSQLARETDPAKRDTLIENALVAQGKAPQQGERLTLPERRGNLEIDAARKAVAGMTPEEIRRKTAKQTDTGRENPDFDPALERAVSLAARRKIGDDPVFDQRHAQPAQSSTQPAGDVSSRFSADPAMKSHRLGKQTELGTEVFDASGKLIGHYR